MHCNGGSTFETHKNKDTTGEPSMTCDHQSAGTSSEDRNNHGKVIHERKMPCHMRNRTQDPSVGNHVKTEPRFNSQK